MTSQELLKEITLLGNLYWEGRLSADLYYELVDFCVAIYKLTRD